MKIENRKIEKRQTGQSPNRQIKKAPANAEALLLLPDLRYFLNLDGQVRW